MSLGSRTKVHLSCGSTYSETCHIILKFYSKSLCFLVMYILFDIIIPLVKYYNNWDNTLTVQTRQEDE